MPTPARIFLCYARPDVDRVRELYQRLTAAGFKPWMDEEDLIPGEPWRPSIERALQQSDFFLACLSAHSVSRRGFLQRKIKTALDLWEEKLGSDIFLIPARLEPCEVPAELADFQWVNLYEERGWPRLLRALEVGLERRAQLTETIGQEPPLGVTGTTPSPPSVTVSPSRPTQPSADARSDVTRQLERMRSTDLSARERVAAGDALARLGDPCFRTDAWYLPDDLLLGFVEIPAGSFLMGSDKALDPEADDNELPQHEITLPRYFIGRYPVTAAQFRAFVEASGYQLLGQDPADSPLDGLTTHPVVFVNWNDALKYGEWLTARLREWHGTPEPLATLLRQESWCVTLPSEAEWEKAARGTDGRIYPWGYEADANRANYEATGIKARSAVGCFPGGASPYGVEDMSGNVWEWTRSVDDRYPYPTAQEALAQRENLGASENTPRVLRGGAFGNVRRFVRCAYRFRNFPNDWVGHLGVRVVVRPGR